MPIAPIACESWTDCNKSIKIKTYRFYELLYKQTLEASFSGTTIIYKIFETNSSFHLK